MTDKIGVLEAFLERADAILIGGAMAFPFFGAQGHSVGDSLCADEDLEPARALLERGSDKLRLPVDLVLGERFDADAERRELDGVDVPDGWMGLDIGPEDVRRPTPNEIAGAGTVFWNGPMGAFELEPFAPARARSPRRSPRRPARPWWAAATRRPRSRSSGSPTASPTCPPAAARRSS